MDMASVFLRRLLLTSSASVKHLSNPPTAKKVRFSSSSGRLLVLCFVLPLVEPQFGCCFNADEPDRVCISSVLFYTSCSLRIEPLSQWRHL